MSTMTAARPSAREIELQRRQVLVMTSLAGGAKHGYAIMQDVESFHGAKLGPGTLYGALTRLQEDGLIEARPSDPSVSGPRRKPFALTELGRVRLAEALDEYRLIANVGLGRL